MLANDQVSTTTVKQLFSSASVFKLHLTSIQKKKSFSFIFFFLFFNVNPVSSLAKIMTKTSAMLDLCFVSLCH